MERAAAEVRLERQADLESLISKAHASPGAGGSAAHATGAPPAGLDAVHVSNKRAAHAGRLLGPREAMKGFTIAENAVTTPSPSLQIGLLLASSALMPLLT